MKPLKAAVYGACHAPALERVLKSDPNLQGRIEFVPVDTCMAITEAGADAFAARMGELDLLIYQPISEDFRGPRIASAHFLEKAGAHTRSISFAYYHFEAYTPYSTLAPKLLPPSPTDYVDYLLAAAVAEGLDDRRIVDRLLHFEAFEPYAPTLLAAALEMLRLREARVLEGDRPLDVRLADRIEAAFRDTRLGHTMNHPTAPVFGWLAQEVTGRMASMFGLEAASAPRLTDPLNEISFPVAPYVAEAFHLAFEDPPSVTVHGRRSALEAYVAAQRPYYAAIPRETLTTVLQAMAASRPWYAPLLEPQAGFGRIPSTRRAVDGAPPRLGRTVIRCDGGGGSQALAEGWSQPEPTGVWSDGVSAAIEVTAPDTAGRDLVVQLDGLAYVPPGVEGQGVQVSVGGEVLVDWVVRPGLWRRYGVAVPARLFSPDEPLRLELAIPGAASPADDPRLLGVAVQGVTLSH